MSRANHSTSTRLLGILAGGVFLLGLLGFVFVMMTGPASTPGQSLFAKAPPASSIHPDVPRLPERNFEVEPLSVAQKATHAEQLAGSLGMLEGGWTLRPFDLGDLVILRSDLKPCVGGYNADAKCNFMRPEDTLGLWTYRRGEERIAVALIYHRDRNAFPRAKTVLAPRIGAAKSDIFRKGVPEGAWKDIGTRAGFALRKLPADAAEGAQVPGLHRVAASRKGDGEVTVYLATNTDLETGLNVLSALDDRLIKALVAEPVLSQDDAIAEIAARKVAFDVISDAALRQKVADMSRKQRNGYVKGIMQDALTKGRSPQDYEITYFAPGPVGHADTIAYLTGEMSKGHPGYKVLETESRRSLPVGTCLQTPHDIYCGKKAEYLRIAHEIRRRNHARAEVPQD